MIEVGSRARSQPPPPHVVFEALVSPDLDSARPWLTILDDEQLPTIGKTEEFTLVTWSSLWVKRPDAVIRFELDGDSSGTSLRWTLLVDGPPPDDALIGHMRKRMNQLINANLRYTFGQWAPTAHAQPSHARPCRESFASRAVQISMRRMNLAAAGRAVGDGLVRSPLG